MPIKRSSEQRLAAHRAEKKRLRAAEAERLRGKRMRVAKALWEMQQGKSITAAARAARTTPAAIRAETTPGSLPVKDGRITAASSSRVRLDLGRAKVLTPGSRDPVSVRMRTLRDWELWLAQDRMLRLVAANRPVPPELERQLQSATIDGQPLVSSPEVAASIGAGGGTDETETLSPILADDTDGGA